MKFSIAGSLRDREVACSASDRQGSNFESCVWRTVSSQSSHHPQEVLLAQFSLYVHKGGLKPDSFHFPWEIVDGISLKFSDVNQLFRSFDFRDFLEKHLYFFIRYLMGILKYSQNATRQYQTLFYFIVNHHIR